MLENVRAVWLFVLVSKRSLQFRTERYQLAGSTQRSACGGCVCVWRVLFRNFSNLERVVLGVEGPALICSDMPDGIYLFIFPWVFS